MSNNGRYNDLIVSAKPAKIVSTKKCDSLSSSASNSSSSDEESASERNGSYDFVIAEENRKNNGVMASEKKEEFPAKKYEIVNKTEVPKTGFLSNDANKGTQNPNPHINVNNGGGDTSYRESWKARNKAEQQNTMVFNFVNTKRDVTHIENDGLDLSKRTSKKKTQIQLSKDPGVILLDPIGPGESTDGDSNDDEDENGANNTLSHEESSTECNFTFIGANVMSGKSSMRSKPKDKKLSISFSESLTEVFEYPSYESSLASPESNTTSILNAKNTSIGGSFGGLGSYTPSKIQMDAGDTKFQLGVSRAIPNSTPIGKMESVTTAQKHSPNNISSKDNNKNTSNGEDSVLLRPTEDAISWSGSSSSSDILF